MTKAFRAAYYVVEGWDNHSDSSVQRKAWNRKWLKTEMQPVRAENVT